MIYLFEDAPESIFSKLLTRAIDVESKAKLLYCGGASNMLTMAEKIVKSSQEELV